MENHFKQASLIPYLESVDSGFKLKLSLSCQNSKIEKESPSPFMVASETDPVARVVEAQLATDANCEIEPVLLFVQKDKYRFTSDELWPISNLDIDKCWQRAFSFYSENRINKALILADQIGRDSNLIPFCSLFYCKLNDCFFHPPCPQCGYPLDLCRDDDILKHAGLLPYTSSLKRYMFCPACVSSGKTSCFYVYDPDNNDPSTIKGQIDLIKSFGQIRDKNRYTDSFPCAGCTNNENCYGVEGLATSTISVFSFYPFYMLMFEGDSINAVDYLALISGVSSEDFFDSAFKKNQPGKIYSAGVLKRNCQGNADFFFDHEENFFLEVLFLKLSFLIELFKVLFQESDLHRTPDFGLSLDRVWIKLVDQGGLMPSLWNFKLKMIDIGGNSPKNPVLSKYSPSFGPQFFGAVCLYTLLVNKKQTISDIYDTIGQLIENIDLNQRESLCDNFKKKLNKAFLPENIFWDPDGKIVSGTGISLWEKALDCGWSLLVESYKGAAEFLNDKFQQELEQIRKEVKNSIFEQQPHVTISKPVCDKKSISDILTAIMEKWRIVLDEKIDEPPETIIFSPTDPADDKIQVDDIQENLEETFILSPQKSKFPQELTETKNSIQKDLSKEASPPEDPDTKLDETDRDADMLETVILSPSKKKPVPTPSMLKTSLSDDELEKTINFKSKIDENIQKGIGPSDNENDWMTETVILQPEKKRDKE